MLDCLESLEKEKVDLDDIEETESIPIEDLAIDLDPEESYSLKKYLRKSALYDI